MSIPSLRFISLSVVGFFKFENNFQNQWFFFFRIIFACRLSSFFKHGNDKSTDIAGQIIIIHQPELRSFGDSHPY